METQHGDWINSQDSLQYTIPLFSKPDKNSGSVGNAALDSISVKNAERVENIAENTTENYDGNLAEKAEEFQSPGFSSSSYVPVSRPYVRRRKLNVKKSSQEELSITGLISKQLVACIIILLIAVALKTFNNQYFITVKDAAKQLLTDNIMLQLPSVDIFANDDPNKSADTATNNAPTVKVVTNATTASVPSDLNTPTVSAALVNNVEGDYFNSQDAAVPVFNQSTGDDTTTDTTTDTANNTANDTTMELFNLIAPVYGNVTSAYGERINPISGVSELHTGVDIDAYLGTPIKSVMDGTVMEAGVSKIYGNYVKVQNGNIEFVYGHCSKISVKKDQSVKQGDVLGNVGDSGYSLGVHLHFEIWMDGKSVNPEDYISFEKPKN